MTDELSPELRAAVERDVWRCDTGERAREALTEWAHRVQRAEAKWSEAAKAWSGELNRADNAETARDEAVRHYVTRLCERHTSGTTVDVPPGGACPHCLNEARELCWKMRDETESVGMRSFPWERESAEGAGPHDAFCAEMRKAAPNRCSCAPPSAAARLLEMAQYREGGFDAMTRDALRLIADALAELDARVRAKS